MCHGTGNGVNTPYYDLILYLGQIRQLKKSY